MKKLKKASCVEEELLRRVLLDNYEKDPDFDQECHQFVEEYEKQRQEKEEL